MNIFIQPAFFILNYFYFLFFNYEITTLSTPKEAFVNASVVLLYSHLVFLFLFIFFKNKFNLKRNYLISYFIGFLLYKFNFSEFITMGINEYFLGENILYQRDLIFDKQHFIAVFFYASLFMLFYKVFLTKNSDFLTKIFLLKYFILFFALSLHHFTNLAYVHYQNFEENKTIFQEDVKNIEVNTFFKDCLEEKIDCHKFNVYDENKIKEFEHYPDIYNTLTDKDKMYSGQFYELKGHQDSVDTSFKEEYNLYFQLNIFQNEVYLLIDKKPLNKVYQTVFLVSLTVTFLVLFWDMIIFLIINKHQSIPSIKFNQYPITIFEKIFLGIVFFIAIFYSFAKLIPALFLFMLCSLFIKMKNKIMIVFITISTFILLKPNLVSETSSIQYLLLVFLYAYILFNMNFKNYQYHLIFGFLFFLYLLFNIGFNPYIIFATTLITTILFTIKLRKLNIKNVFNYLFFTILFLSFTIINGIYTTGFDSTMNELFTSETTKEHINKIATQVFLFLSNLFYFSITLLKEKHKKFNLDLK